MNIKKFSVIQRLSQSPDLNPDEHLWDMVKGNLQLMCDAIMWTLSIISKECLQYLLELPWKKWANEYVLLWKTGFWNKSSAKNRLYFLYYFAQPTMVLDLIPVCRGGKGILESIMEFISYSSRNRKSPGKCWNEKKRQVGNVMLT